MKLKLKSPKASAKAMTLVEVLIGMAIFGVLFISLYGGIGAGLAIIRNAREDLRATQVMLEKMETIRLYNWDQVTQNGYIPLTFSAPYWPADGTNGLQCHGTMTITNVPFNESYSTNMRQVIVNVNWRSGTVVHQREMRTMVSRHGLQNYIY